MYNPVALLSPLLSPLMCFDRHSMDVLSIIRAFLQEHLRIAPEQVIPAASLKELRIDSLTLLELMFECEERLNASIADDTPMPGTIAELIAIVDKYSVPRQ